MDTSRIAKVGALLVTLGVLGGGGWLGARWWTERTRVQMLATGEQLLADGHLREAAGVAATLRTDYPDHLDGFSLGARTSRALHDRPGTADLLQQGYDVAPHGFALLPELVDHRMRGPDDPGKAYAALAFLDQHLADFPDDANLVAQARLVALVYLLDQKTLPPEKRAEAETLAQAALDAFHIDGTGTTEQHHDRAQVLLALGKVDACIAEARLGIAAGTDKWEALVMEWALITLELHHGQDEAAWNDLQGLQKDMAVWPGTHFGMGKPLVELVQLTSAIRFGRRLDAPPDYADRLARLDAEGVRLQYGEADTRALVGELLAAMDRRDTASAEKDVDDLLGIVARDRGDAFENQIIRPNTEAILLAAKGNLLLADKQYTAAEAAYTLAQAIFPDDAWFGVKIETAQMDALGPDKFNPVTRLRPHAP